MSDEKTNGEILEEAERQAAGEPERFPWAVEWMRRVTAGEADPALLEEALRKGETRLWPTLVARFDEGELFGAQQLDFPSVLTLDQKEVEKDLRTWENVRAAARGAKQSDGPKIFEMRDFVMTRIGLDARIRRTVHDDGYRLRALASLPKGTQDWVASHRESFQRATDKYRWWWASPWLEERIQRRAEYAAAGGHT